MTEFTRRVLPCLFCAFVLCGSAANAQTCNVSPEKRVLITSILCGSNASESQYRAEGTGCVERAFKVRLLDTAKQVAVLRACGDGEFATKMRSGTLQSMKFIQALSVCAGERLDFDALYDAAEREVATRATMLVCTGELQSIITAQRPKLQRNLDVALDPASSRAIEDRLAVVVDVQGNVTERPAP